MGGEDREWYVEFKKDIGRHDGQKYRALGNVYNRRRQHNNTSTHQHINTSTRQHPNTSTHQHINTPTHQHINTSTHQHINTSTHQPYNTPPNQHTNTTIYIHNHHHTHSPTKDNRMHDYHDQDVQLLLLSNSTLH